MFYCFHLPSLHSVTVALIFSVGGCVVCCLAPAGHLWYMIGKRAMGCHTQRTFFFFCWGVWSSACKTDPFKVLGSCTSFENEGGGGVLLKRCISQEVEIADPLSAVPSVTYFFLAVQAFEGDIEVRLCTWQSCQKQSKSSAKLLLKYLSMTE